MGEQIIVFECTVCHKNYEKAKKDHPAFEITGLDNVMDWSDFRPEDNLPRLDERIWARSEKAPTAGERRIVQVHSHFHMSLGESFWTLFTPALSHFNGWDSHPEEIEASAFVRCKLERVLDRNEQKAWVELYIEEVALLSELCAKVPPRDGSGYAEHLGLYRDSHIFQWQDWFLVTSSAEGDLGVWGLVRKTAGHYHLVTMGDWDFHLDMAYGGNLVLPESEWDEMLNKCTWYG